VAAVFASANCPELTFGSWCGVEGEYLPQQMGYMAIFKKNPESCCRASPLWLTLERAAQLANPGRLHQAFSVSLKASKLFGGDERPTCAPDDAHR
jgi:hypothetical protein